MNVFTIVKIGWEYNDEYYYQPEQGGGDPLVVYKNRASVEKECLKLNIEQYKSTAASSWGSIGAFFNDYDSSDIDEDKPTLEKLGVTFKGCDISLPKTQTDENWILIIALMKVVFYKIEQLEFVE